MKRLFFPLLTLVLLGSFAFANAAFVTGHVEAWCSDLAQAEQAAREERWADAIRVLETFNDDWLRSSIYFHIVIRHDEIDDAEGLLAEAIAFASEEHDAEFHASVAKLSTQLQRLAEAEELSIKNVL